jgi:hypothetical protein
MNLRRNHSPAIAGAKAGFSTATGYRFETDPRLPSQRKARREVRLRDPPGGAGWRWRRRRRAEAGYAATAVVTRAAASWRAFQAQGIISPTRWAGWSGSLARTSASQARGSTSLSLHVYAARRTMPNWPVVPRICGDAHVIGSA